VDSSRRIPQGDRKALESLLQYFERAPVALSGSPLIGWSRTHREGLNTGYLDGHAEMFDDAQRKTAFFKGQGYNYGSGAPLQAGAFDIK